MTAEQLKASVLQMAIEGRLVPQLEEEPAVSLDVEEPDDVPFAIPEKWKWVRLGELVIPCSQKVPDKKFNYIDVSSIDNKKHKLGEVKITLPENAPSRARKIVKNGMVIYSTVRPYLLNTCIIDGDFSDEIICSTAFVAVECKDIVLNGYLLDVLISPYFCEYVKDIQKGVAYPAITDKGFYSALFPLPPLEEQRRIVARLDEILPLIESYGKAHNALEAVEKALPDKLRASLLQEAISGRLVPQLDEEPAVSLDVEEPDDVPFAIPEKWKWVRIRELVIPCSQKVPDKKFNYIDVASIDNKKHKLGEVKITFPENAPSRARKIVKNGMVIYSTVRPYLLNTCIINGNFSDEIICSTAFVAVECKNILLNEYFLNVLISPYFCEYVKDIQRGVAYPAITDKGFYSAPFPLPPLEEQHRIVARLNELLPCVEAMAKLHDGEKR